eukprot:NODE_670_length_4858_cov_0.883379.p4 type:complete len:110 gc:universal NODE_670_length_4858_cov_0.883379:2971-3300(+)
MGRYSNIPRPIPRLKIGIISEERRISGRYPEIRQELMNRRRISSISSVQFSSMNSSILSGPGHLELGIFLMHFSRCLILNRRTLVPLLKASLVNWNFNPSSHLDRRSKI